MTKITKYEVIYGNSEAKLVETINDLIKDGWQPIGGISVCFHHNGSFQQIIYHQAMVLYAA